MLRGGDALVNDAGADGGGEGGTGGKGAGKDKEPKSKDWIIKKFAAKSEVRGMANRLRQLAKRNHRNCNLWLGFVFVNAGRRLQHRAPTKIQHPQLVTGSSVRQCSV